MKPVLTINELNKQYLYWMNKYGNNRSDNDLRFGQYIHILYEIPNFNISESDGFYSEDVNLAYEIIINKIK